jgi:hypothetical protein
MTCFNIALFTKFALPGLSKALIALGKQITLQENSE